MSKKILILGSTGMLGSMVFSYFSKQSSYESFASSRDKDSTKKSSSLIYFDALTFLENKSNYDYLKNYDYIINCIGIIKPYCKDNDPKGVVNAIKVNALFPHELSKFLENSKTKIIQIATDCVYSGKKGDYKEGDIQDPLDVYGKTKSLGEVNQQNFLNIRCSIIGPENKNKVSLLEWFLSNPQGSKLNGFSHHSWNGVTTLQFAQLCKEIIDQDSFQKLREISHVYHYVPNKTVNKFQLLKIFNQVYKKEFVINEVDNIGDPVKRTLSTKYLSFSPKVKRGMRESIEELKEYSLKNYV